MDNDIIVTRHAATEAWIRERIRGAGRDDSRALKLEQVRFGPGAPHGLLPHLTDPSQGEGLTHVWGTVPLDILASASHITMRYHAVTVEAPPGQRRKDLRGEEFDLFVKMREWAWQRGEGSQPNYGLFPID